MTLTDACETLVEQYARKNHDYGNSAHQTYEQFGDVAYMTRISDKLNRWEQLLNNKAQVKTECLADTMGDTFTYCCMWLAEYEPENSKAISDIMEDIRFQAENFDFDNAPIWFQLLLARFRTFDADIPVATIKDWASLMAICALMNYTKTINNEVI